MTSGNFDHVAVASINRNREQRQRRELVKIEELAESIRANGLINPIVITRDFNLVAGERRLAAHIELGYDTIAVQFAEDLDPIQLHLLELEENVRRVDLTWFDHVKAVADFHRIKTETTEKWNAVSTAESLNMSHTHVARHLAVAEAIEEGVPEVLEAPKFSVAANFVERRNERKKASAMRDLSVELAPKSARVASYSLSGDIIHPNTESAPTARFAAVDQGDFKDWSKIVQTVPYNFIHVDFPYGVSAGDKTGQSSAKTLGGYADSKDIYFELLASFCNNLDNFCDPSAHLMFWFSLDYYQHTYDALKSAGWAVNPFPLIWHKTDNSGILPDPNRGPRRTYETAFFASRGDRKIVRAVANSFGCGTPPKDDKIHMSEKPRPMLEHFFRMIVDENTLLLDPTAGSGNAIRVAESMGARFSQGIELNPDYVERARTSLGL
jgi:ParB/RepB/Spo0J family partition protein